jgi:hypothetical protein
MNFSDALKMLKEGQKICRFTWKSKDMYLCIRNPQLLFPDKSIMKWTGQMLIPWVTSSNNILAEDWMVVE